MKQAAARTSPATPAPPQNDGRSAASHLDRALAKATELFAVSAAFLVCSTPDGLTVQASRTSGAWNPRDALSLADLVLRSGTVETTPLRSGTDQVAMASLAAGSWAGVPIKGLDGVCRGALCLFDHRPRPPLSAIQRRLLFEFARSLADQVLPTVEPPTVPDLEGDERGVEDLPEAAMWLPASRNRHRPGQGPAEVSEAPRSNEPPPSLLIDELPYPTYIYDCETLRFRAVNGAALAFYGRDRVDFLSLTILDIRPDREHAAALEAVASLSKGINDDRHWTHLHADGRELVVSTRCRTLVRHGRREALAIIIDQPDSVRVEHELRRTRVFLDSVLNSIPVGVFVKDMQDEGRYLLYNRAGGDLVDQPGEQIVGRTDPEVFGAEHAARFMEQDRAVIAKSLLITVEEKLPRGNGEIRTILTRKVPMPNELGGESRYVLGVSEDVTERRVTESRISYMAHHDALTDLPNRVLLRERLEMALARAARYGEQLAVLSLDLDDFKPVNDALGHPIGDRLLRAVADRLRQTLRGTDTAARLGGDEFAILQVPLKSPDDVAALAVRLIDAIGAPFDVEGHQLLIGASIGIALAPADGTDPDILLRNSDIALYRAKIEGRGTFRLFEAAMNTRIQARRAFEVELRHALSRGELELHYQPLVDMATRRIMGCEALLRWHHPERGLVSAAEFIPMAEEIGLMLPLGDWVLRQACADAARWPGEMKVAVNVSPVQFKHRNLAASVLSALAAAGLPPSRLELEITETVLLADTEANLSVLHQLHALGVRISLDDFGTGYSSLGYLRSFPFSKIKIDRSFIRDLETSSNCLAIIRAVTGLGSSLGVTTIAEGVETVGQLERLRAEGCTAVQGYLFSHPLPARDILDELIAHSISNAAA